MTWGEIQIESLKKMFLNKEQLKVEDLENYRQDKKYKIYLDAMPQACNEAINYIINLEPLVSTDELTKINENYNYNLNDELMGFKRLINILSETNVDWKMLSKNIIRIENWKSGKVEVLYESYPRLITANTKNTTKIELEETFARLIPLYIAGELYKDDDLTLATVYMNEFMTNINAMVSEETVVNNSINSVYRMEW